MWNNSVSVDENTLDQVKELLISHNEIREVIISGGEPFLLHDELLDKVLSDIYSIPHIESVRIGTIRHQIIPPVKLHVR